MKFLDLYKMSLDNLLRRKLRTMLTVLGVIIGTASIVVMLSLGLGLKRASLKQIEQYGGITTVNVFAGEGQLDENGKKKEEKLLDDKLTAQIANIPHVELVSPVLQIDMMARFGKYQSTFSVRGMTGEALRKMNLKIGRGKLPSENSELQLFFGNQVQNSFYSPRGDGTAPAIDFMKDQIFYILDTESYYQFQNGQGQSAAETITGGGSGESVRPVTPPKKYQFPACGVLAGGPEEYSNNSFEVYADLEALKAQVKKAFKNKVIPGQPANKKGKPYKEFNEVFVNGKEKELSNIEYQMLLLMMRHPRKIFSAQNLYESIWNEPWFYSCSSTVMVHIRKLRVKIEPDPQKPVYIKTDWGKGYKFDGIH